MTALEYWEEFLRKHPELPQDIPFDAWSFGGASDALAELVVQGTKTATCSLLSVYKDGSVPLPRPGSYSVLLNSKGEPKAVIFLKETYVKKFSEIDKQHAWEEGEGDRSLKHWREVHLRFFSVYEGFSENSELLCEKFENLS
jgi:uncharacterized protein YhfF